MPPRGKKKTKNAARKTKRTARSRAGASRKTSARKTATSRKPAAKRSAKRTAKRTAKPAAKRSASSRKPSTTARRIAKTAPIAPAFGGGMAGGEPDEIIILSTDELLEETDIDLGGDEDGGDDDLEGM